MIFGLIQKTKSKILKDKSVIILVERILRKELTKLLIEVYENLTSSKKFLNLLADE